MPTHRQRVAVGKVRGIGQGSAKAGKGDIVVSSGQRRNLTTRLAAQPIMHAMKTFLLYVVTAVAEIAGCYFPYRWLKAGGSAWLVVPGALSLALFAWLLTLHDTAAGRIYAAYGGVYIGVAIAWLWAVDRIRPTAWDVTGAAIALIGMSVIAFQPR